MESFRPVTTVRKSRVIVVSQSIAIHTLRTIMALRYTYIHNDKVGIKTVAIVVVARYRGDISARYILLDLMLIVVTVQLSFKHQVSR